MHGYQVMMIHITRGRPAVVLHQDFVWFDVNNKILYVNRVSKLKPKGCLCGKRFARFKTNCNYMYLINLLLNARYFI